VHLGEHVDLLVLLVEKILKLTNFSLELSYPLFERLCVTPRERSAAELIACSAFEAYTRTLGARGPDAIAANLFAVEKVSISAVYYQHLASIKRRTHCSVS
jgi:hypothetical protein